MRTITALLLGAALLAATAHAQQPHAGEIAAGLQRLGTVGSVLYVAAHPDDENTRLLAWLVGGKHLRAGYLSLTRGDGGQNLIGTEQGDLLGLIRTQELLAARRVDGAEQLFTRAKDFGYSKSAEETLKVWGKEAVLADVVLAIRRFRPDVVITRFNTQPPNHGHHTASALLAAEAFAAAADPQRFPEQLGAVRAWRAGRLLHNVSTWRMAPDADMSGFLSVDVGGYDPLIGLSWGEVAAHSRSQHKSQGFGVAAQRGTSLEYFEPVAGTAPAGDIFSGIDFSWRRYPGTESVVVAIDAAIRGFDARAPHRSIPALQKVHAAIAALPDTNPWRAVKLAEAEALIAACAGLFLEARAAEPTVVPGTALSLQLVALNRSPASARLVSVTLPGQPAEALDAALAQETPVLLDKALAIPRDAPISTPYWLRTPSAGGLHEVPEQALVGQPEGEPALSVTFAYEIEGQPFTVSRPVVHAHVDPVRGELYQTVEIAPAVTATFDRDVVMLPNGKPQEIGVTLAAGRPGAAGKLRLEVPAGWRVEPAEVPFTLAARGEERTERFRIVPPKDAETGTLRAVTEVDGRAESWRAWSVSYDHIPPQTVRQAATAPLVPLALATGGKRIGYIQGPGDRVAESLAAVGYEVTLLPEERLGVERLDRFDAILVGVRAFNEKPRLALHRDRLLAYVEKGGRLVVQYNTNNRLAPLTVQLGPHPFEIGRDRVTDETAPMVAVDPADPVLKRPNRLVPADFDGWVQERGLYFASKWDDRYRPIFALQDPGEAPLRGALLVAKHGKGIFAYTGLAFFRQLPAGVPGAYRLLANLLAR